MECPYRRVCVRAMFAVVAWTIIHTSWHPMHSQKDAEEEHGVHVGKPQRQQ